jgi:hypothetical protein
MYGIYTLHVSYINIVIIILFQQLNIVSIFWSEISKVYTSTLPNTSINNGTKNATFDGFEGFLKIRKLDSLMYSVV